MKIKILFIIATTVAFKSFCSEKKSLSLWTPRKNLQLYFQDGFSLSDQQAIAQSLQDSTISGDVNININNSLSSPSASHHRFFSPSGKHTIYYNMKYFSTDTNEHERKIKDVTNHEIGHFAFNHHLKRGLEEGSKWILGLNGLLCAGGSFLPTKSVIQNRFLTVGLTSWALAAVKFKLDEQPYFQKKRLSWYKNQELQATHYAISKSSCPKQTSEYLVNY